MNNLAISPLPQDLGLVWFKFVIAMLITIAVLWLFIWTARVVWKTVDKMQARRSRKQKRVYLRFYKDVDELRREKAFFDNVQECYEDFAGAPW